MTLECVEFILKQNWKKLSKLCGNFESFFCFAHMNKKSGNCFFFHFGASQFSNANGQMILFAKLRIFSFFSIPRMFELNK